MEEPLLDFVLRELKDSEKPLRLIAEEAGVPYFTVQKWKRKWGTKNPRIDTVQKLADYFRSPEAKRNSA